MIYHITLDTTASWLETRPLCGLLTQEQYLYGNHLWSPPDSWGEPIHESYTRCVDCMNHPDFPISQDELGIVFLAELP